MRDMNVIHLPLSRQRVPLDPPERQVAQLVGIGLGRRRASIKHVVQFFYLFGAVLGVGSDRDEATRRSSEGCIGVAAQPAECYGEEFHLFSLPDIEESYK